MATECLDSELLRLTVSHPKILIDCQTRVLTREDLDEACNGDVKLLLMTANQTKKKERIVQTRKCTYQWNELLK